MDQPAQMPQAPYKGTPIDALQTLASRSGARIMSTNHFDANVSGSPFSKASRATINKRKVELLASETFLSIELKGNYAELGGLAINQPEKICLLSRPSGSISFEGLEYPTFTGDGLLSSEQKYFLHSISMRDFLKIAAMETQECLVIYKNAVLLYLAMPSSDRAAMLVEALMILFPSSDKSTVTLESERWPLVLQSLLPVATKWAVEDDLEREEVLVNASVQELQILVDQVHPKLALIDSYLDGKSKLPKGIAIRLHALAQAALEAERLLRT